MQNLLFLLFDPVSVDRAASVLRSCKLKSVIVTADLTVAPNVDAIICADGTPRIFVVLIDHTAVRDVERRCRRAFTIVFVTPGLLLLSDLLNHTRVNPQPAAQRLAAFSLNTRSRGDALQFSMEALYFRPAEIATVLAADAGLVEDCWREALPDPAPADYRAALSQLLARISVDPTSPLFAASTVYPVCSGEIATVALGPGWSRPESRYTWSEGPRSVLYLLAPPSPTGPMHLRCRGYVVDAGLQITIFIHGTMVSVIDKALDRPRDVMIDVPLFFWPTLQERLVTLEFAFDNTVVPAERGMSGDRRRLAFAISSVEFYTDNQQGGAYPKASQISVSGEPTRCIDLSAVPSRGSPEFLKCLRALAAVVGESGYAFCVFLVEEENLAADCWAVALRMLKVGAAVVVAGTRCIILLSCGNECQVLPSEKGLLELVDVFSHSKNGMALLIAWSSSRIPDLISVWDRLLASPNACDPGVAIRTNNFQDFEAINEPRRVYNAVISYHAGVIILEPNGRGWNE